MLPMISSENGTSKRRTFTLSFLIKVALMGIIILCLIPVLIMALFISNKGEFRGVLSSSEVFDTLGKTAQQAGDQIWAIRIHKSEDHYGDILGLESDEIIKNAPFSADKDEERYQVRNEFFSNNLPLALPRLTAGSPLCHRPDHGVPLQIYIMMATWNDIALLKESISSVSGQELPSFPFKVGLTLLVYEDTSGEMLTEREKSLLSATMDIQFMRAEGCTSLFGCPQLGSAGSKWRLLKRLKDIANPSDYVIVLDGDDVFADKHVIRDLAALVLPTKPWFIWGKHNGKYSEQCKDVPRYDNNVDLRKYRFREEYWGYCHPRMFQAHLLNTIDESDFQRPDGSWLQKATDRPFIFKMLETSGVERTHFFDERAPTVNYTFTASNGLVRFDKKVIQGDKNYVNGLPPLETASQIIHVVAAIYDRKNTQLFVKNLVASASPEVDDYDIEFEYHLCLNDASRLEEILIIAKMYSTTRRRVRVHVMDDNHGGFSRFIVAQKLRREQNVEYIIMLDDDMIVYTETLRSLWEKRAPLTFSCWYGKFWEIKDDKEVDYWRPSIGKDTTKDTPIGSMNILTKNKLSEWQYGGTGCSIVDASIFDDPLLFKIPLEYLHVEDLWLSYVVLLRGWRIPRIRGVHFELDYDLNNAGQWSNADLKTKKSDMLIGLSKCDFPIFEMYDFRRKLWPPGKQEQL